MQANWSLVLNILLLIGVVVAIGRTVRDRRKKTQDVPRKPSVGQVDKTNYEDIIAVRKINTEESAQAPFLQPVQQPVVRPTIASVTPPPPPPPPPLLEEKKVTMNGVTPSSVMIFLLAKENRQLAGYELLQTLLASGLRFGEGQLFHRHQHSNGQGPVLCSLAAATASGVFDLQNIGAFSVRGLCMFMHASGNSTIDADRFEIMLDTAKQLSDGLDTLLLDDQRKPLSDASLRRYYQQLNISDRCESSALV